LIHPATPQRLEKPKADEVAYTKVEEVGVLLQVFVVRVKVGVLVLGVLERIVCRFH